MSLRCPNTSFCLIGENYKKNFDEKSWKYGDYVYFATRYLGQGVHQEVYKHKDKPEFRWCFAEMSQRFPLKEFPIDAYGRDPEDGIQLDYFLECMANVKFPEKD